MSLQDWGSWQKISPTLTDHEKLIILLNQRMDPLAQVTKAVVKKVNQDTTFDIRDWGEHIGEGHDDTDAVLGTFAEASDWSRAKGGAKVRVGQGVYNVGKKIPLDAYRVHVEGDGEYATIFQYLPETSGDPLFLLQMPDPTQLIAQVSLRGFSVLGLEGVKQKILIDAWDGSDITIEDVICANWRGNNGNVATPSIAVRSHGREIMRLRHLTLFADRPVHIMKNPNTPGQQEDGDHFHGQDLYLGTQAATEAAMLIDPDVSLSSFTLDGYQVNVLGKYGIWAQGGAVPVQSTRVKISGHRYEQPQVLGGWGVSWELPTLDMQYDGALGGSFAPTNGGFYGRHITRLTFGPNTSYTGVQVGANIPTCLDLDDCDDVQGANCFWQDTSVAVLANLEQLYGSTKNSLAPIAPNFHYINPLKHLVRGIQRNNTWETLYSGLVPAGGVLPMPLLSTVFGERSGQVIFTAYAAGGGGIKEGGSAQITPLGESPLFGGTPLFALGNVPGRVCVFFNGGNPPLIMNNLAQPLYIAAHVVAVYG